MSQLLKENGGACAVVLKHERFVQRLCHVFVFFLCLNVCMEMLSHLEVTFMVSGEMEQLDVISLLVLNLFIEFVQISNVFITQLIE